MLDFPMLDNLTLYSKKDIAIKRKKKKVNKQSPKSEKPQSVNLKTDDKEYW